MLSMDINAKYSIAHSHTIYLGHGPYISRPNLANCKFTLQSTLRCRFYQKAEVLWQARHASCLVLMRSRIALLRVVVYEYSICMWTVTYS